MARSRGGVRERILQAGTRLLAARGFDGTTIQAVADAVGIRKPSVLHHFPSKEALREGVIGEMLEHFGRVLPRVLQAAGAGGGSPAGISRFDALTHEVVRFFAADADRARLLVRETLDRPREIRQLFADRVRPWLSMLADFIREGQRRGVHHAEVDPDSYLVHILHLIVVGIAARGVFSPRRPGDPVDRRDTFGREIRELLRIARTSLFPSPAPRARARRGAQGSTREASPPSRRRPRKSRTPRS